MSATSSNQDKQVFRLVLGISIFVFLAVVVLNRKLITPPAEVPSFIYFLPGLNAFLNGTCSILLILSYIFIRRKQVAIHKKINLTAFVLSSLFLLSYIAFHFYISDTLYGDLNHDGQLDEAELAGAGSMRLVYLLILVPHIVLAALVLPLVLLSFYHGLQNNVEKHRKLVRWSFPIWLFVTISGVIVYLLISPYYPF